MKPSELQKLLDDLDWSMARLAAEMNLTEAAVRRWLNGEREVTGPALILLGQLRENLKHGVRGLASPQLVTAK